MYNKYLRRFGSQLAEGVILVFTYAKSWRVHFAFVFPHVFYIRLLQSAEPVIGAVFARGTLLTEPHKYMSYDLIDM